MSRGRTACLIPLCAGLALTGGCAASDTYPSLAPRPAERLSLAEPTRPAPPAGTADAAADARFAEPVARARTGDAAFRAKLAELRPVLERGRGAPVGSDAWGAAQTAFSRVQAARGPVAQALLDLQSSSESGATQGDSGLAAAAARALDVVAALDRSEADDLRALAPGGDAPPSPRP